MTPFVSTEEESEWIRLDRPEGVLIIQESTHTFLLDTHRIIEIVELDIEFIKEDIIHLINHQDSSLLFLDKHVYQYA